MGIGKIHIRGIATDYANRPLYCSVCGDPQYTSPSGNTCVNGHGGADGVATPLRQLKQRGPAAVRGPKDDAIHYAAQLGLPVPERPVMPGGQSVELPPEIDQCTSTELGRLYGQISAFASYAAVHVGLADVDRSEARYRADILTAECTLGAVGSNRDERKSYVTLDPQVVQAESAFRVADARYVLLSRLLQGYERSIATISREFSRRELDLK